MISARTSTPDGVVAADDLHVALAFQQGGGRWGTPAVATISLVSMTGRDHCFKPTRGLGCCPCLWNRRQVANPADATPVPPCWAVMPRPGVAEVSSRGIRRRTCAEGCP